MTESVYLILGLVAVSFLSGYVMAKFPSISERLDYIEKNLD